MRIVRIIMVVFSILAAFVFGYTLYNRRVADDKEAPVITADTDSLMVSITATDEELLKGMKAQDNLDGDITNTLVVLSKSKFISKGVLHANYAAFDSSKNVGTYTREITYADYVSPRFSISSPLRFDSSQTNRDFLKNIRATDCLDGDITRQIKLSYGNTTAVSANSSVREFKVQVTNSCGDTSELELTASIEAYDDYANPAPALKDYVIYVPRGGVLDLRSNIIGVWSAGKVKSFDDYKLSMMRDVTISNNGLDLKTPGIYTVEYRLHDELGAALGTAELIVVVEE
ncbi:MAG: hypothetical protein IKX16_06340 [Clostridia bacterium]|nr:hypothetical protein [Clostridia bacterium]